MGDLHDDSITLVKPHPPMASLHWWYHWKCFDFHDCKLYFKL